MIILCIILIVSASVFGAQNTVDVFGFNIYMVQSDGLSTAPKGSAVIVKKCQAYELNKGNLVLFMKGGENKTPELAYVTDIPVEDGSYFVTVDDGGKELRFSEKDLVGHADYSSLALGAVIGFIKTPFGVFCIALLPCVALILFDIIRAAAARMPIPEIVPQVKNEELSDNGKSAANSKLGVNSDGKATYSRGGNGKQKDAPNNVLFSYAGRQQAGKPVDRRPIIPLTDKKTDLRLPERPSSGYTSIININDGSGDPDSRIPAKAAKEAPTNRGALRSDAPRTPVSVAAGRYEQNAQSDRPSTKLSGKTAELPEIPRRKDASDAFFAQTATVTSVNKASSAGEPPQISRLLPENEGKPRSDIAPGRTARTAGKRSTQILASKRMEDLFSDDDDDRDRRRRDPKDSVVDDILAGMDRKK